MQHPVALVDDHHLVRTGLASMVNGLGGYRVMMEAGHGGELIDALNGAAKHATERPALAIVDLNMPVMDGYETLKWLRIHEPDILTLALTFDAADDAMVKAVRSGARGFILKSARPAQLKQALDALVNTGYYYTDEVHAALVRESGDAVADDRLRERILGRLTDREVEFLMLVCSEEEPTYESIAKTMGVHRRTVDNYRTQLFDKLNVKSKTGLVICAMRWGLIK